MRLDQLLRRFPNMRLALRHNEDEFQSNSFDIEVGIREWRVVARPKRNNGKNFRVVGYLQWKR